MHWKSPFGIIWNAHGVSTTSGGSQLRCTPYDSHKKLSYFHQGSACISIISSGYFMIFPHPDLSYLTKKGPTMSNHFSTMIYLARNPTCCKENASFSGFKALEDLFPNLPQSPRGAAHRDYFDHLNVQNKSRIKTTIEIIWYHPAKIYYIIKCYIMRSGRMRRRPGFYTVKMYGIKWYKVVFGPIEYFFHYKIPFAHPSCLRKCSTESLAGPQGPTWFSETCHISSYLYRIHAHVVCSPRIFAHGMFAQRLGGVCIL